MLLVCADAPKDFLCLISAGFIWNFSIDWDFHVGNFRYVSFIIAERNQGLYTLCPTNPNDSGGTEAVPDIVISDPDGELHSKIHTVPPRVLYTNCPKTEEEWVNVRRDAVIQMIIAEGGEPFH